ncbi:MAG: putative DNA topoisomerase 2-like isoform X1 [Sylvanvirus sp.]|uniref:DNA topoisomerase 2 n=1 Tax=Sylvanvirus sp. TaxID=2487774 RepID=A0A3G5AIF8_9VIRU|nr:MAG: putative DNA topoisomerase 2-like isoform X1 [Sylvanvirus sp.]
MSEMLIDSPIQLPNLQSVQYEQQKPGSELVEKKYIKMTQIEHILKRPDTYIGSLKKTTEEGYVYLKSEGRICKQEVTYVPGLFKIFDEVLVNAADNFQRDPTMDTLKVSIDAQGGSVTVWNNGKGIPVTFHTEYNCYIPELILGHLLTSSNYDDTEARMTGGRNGYGFKLTNIFSTKLEVETVDSSKSLKYTQRWTHNMSEKSEPVLKSVKPNTSDYTKITFWPDFEKFGGLTLLDNIGCMTSFLDTDILLMIHKRVVDMAGVVFQKTHPLKVYLNGERIHIKNFKDYVRLCQEEKVCSENEIPEDTELQIELTSTHTLDMNPIKINTDILMDPANGTLKTIPKKTKKQDPFYYEHMGERWEIAVSHSTGSFQQVSFVNSIWTSQGGSHVDYIEYQLSKLLVDYIKHKYKLTVKPGIVKNHLFLFVNALIVNPTFDSQTKTKLNLNRQAFGSKCELDEKFLKHVVTKTKVVEHILAYTSCKDDKELKKHDGKKSKRLTGIPKLEDANDAGGRFSQDCTLILCEGDSAKALVVSGLAVMGRDKYGVFPLKGKLLNVRECEKGKAILNEEIGYLIKILGLQHGKKYDESSAKELRYGHVMICTDQDRDGSHIKGLIINMISAWWPELLRIKGFLLEFITPIVKVKKFVGKNSTALTFFSLPEFETWKSETQNGKGYNIKYYKGLGTSTSLEAKEYFSNLDTHRLYFEYVDEKCDKAIELAFAKGKVEQRKEWLSEYKQGTYLDQSTGVLSYQNFVHKELILFSIASNMRAIPNVVDGLKPSQRKILYVCFFRHLIKELKVAQLAGSVAEKSAYHHGEASLTGAIVGLAQNFVGSNNINLLYPSGQFGTRLNGGKDAASARYIFTNLTKITRFLFPSQDDAVLNYLNDDGLSVEPEYYVPILPTVLVNGSSGIGTGWASTIPNYNPRDLVDWIKARLTNKAATSVPLHPWYRGFTGTIYPSTKRQQYTVYGRLEQIDETTIAIKELPLHTWTTDYKSMLDSMLEGKHIKEVKEYHTDTKVCFLIKMTEEQMMKAKLKGLYKTFKLISSIQTSNMVLFNSRGQLRKYTNPEEIAAEFYDIRLQTYQARKEALIVALQEEVEICQNKVRYIRAVCNGELKLNVKVDMLLQQLITDQYKRVNHKESKEEDIENNDQLENEGIEFKEPKVGRRKSQVHTLPHSNAVPLSDYHYLVHQTQLSLTIEKSKRLEKESEEKQKALEKLIATRPEDTWMNELDTFLIKLKEFEMETLEQDVIVYQPTKRKEETKSKSKNKLHEKCLDVNTIEGVYLDPLLEVIEVKVDKRVNEPKETKLEFNSNATTTSNLTSIPVSSVSDISSLCLADRLAVKIHQMCLPSQSSSNSLKSSNLSVFKKPKRSNSHKKDKMENKLEIKKIENRMEQEEHIQEEYGSLDSSEDMDE